MYFLVWHCCSLLRSAVWKQLVFFFFFFSCRLGGGGGGGGVHKFQVGQ